MQNGDLRIISDDYYIVKATHTNRALHRHEGYEAFYVINGECDHVLVNANTQNTQRLKSGNFVVLDNTVSHRFKNGNNDFCVINFLFKPNFILSDANFSSATTNSSSFVNTIFFDNDKTFLQLFEKAYFAFKNNKNTDKELARCYAKEIILQLIQKLENKNKPRIGISDKIATYAEEYFSQPITLGEICKELHYSLPYVSRKFKQDYLMPFEKFLQIVRIKHACMLLLNTDMSVNEVALAVSYTDTDAFRKIFRLKTGKTPTQFRSNY